MRPELDKAATAVRQPREAGVLICMYPKAGETYFVMMERAEYEGVHSGQIALPGGKVEAGDRDKWHTSLRETEEETGIVARQVQKVMALSELYIPPSNFMVSPFVGYLHETPILTPDPIEVQSLIEVPLEELLDDRSLGVRRLQVKYVGDIEVPVFEFQGKIVWGATAMILSELKSLFLAIEV